MSGDETPRPDSTGAFTHAVEARRPLLARLVYRSAGNRLSAGTQGLIVDDGASMYAFTSFTRPLRVSRGRFLAALELTTDHGIVRFEGYRPQELDRLAGALEAGYAKSVRLLLGDRIVPVERLAAEIDRLFDGTKYIRVAHAQDLANRAASLWMGFGSALSIDHYLDPAQRQHFIRVDSYLRDWRYQVEATNSTFVGAELERHKAFFDVVEKSPLTLAQRRACVVNEAANLVLAGAGTGKTSTMVGRAGYLLMSGAARPSEILMLAFAKKAAEEMQERQVDRLAQYAGGETPPTVKTFHALGLEIIGQAEGRRPALSKLAEDPLAMQTFIDEELARNCEDPDYLADVISWCFNRRYSYENPFDFETETDYLEYVRTNELRTFNGELVKSYEELVIANFLAANGVEYIYESKYRIPEELRAEYEEDSGPHEGFIQDAQHRPYMPDFYLPEHDIYIEHFALNGDMLCPDGWIGYLPGVRWKREVHAHYGTRLLETRSHMQYDGVLEMCLESMLRVQGVQLQPRPIEELLSELRDRGDLTSLARPITDFLGLLKQSDHDLHTLRGRACRLPDADRYDMFFQLFEPVFEAYQGHLKEHDEIDFSDMIRIAIDHVDAGRFSSPYKHVLVDEFQDISALRARLICSLLTQAQDSTLFAVGDDWQAIYRFTGSDIGLIREFEGVFGASATTALDTTFRFNDRISEVASSFVLRNPAQIEKRIASPVVSPIPVVSLVPVADVAAGVRQALAAIERRRVQAGQARASVLVLGRYHFVIEEWASGPGRNRFKAEFPKLDIRFMTVHAAKGSEADYVVVLGVESGRNGFPARKPLEPITELVLPKLEPHPFAEERRLFYVALTRAKHRVYLVYEQSNVSEFVQELLEIDAQTGRLVQANEFIGVPGIGAYLDPIECPSCRKGRLVARSGQFGSFVACSRFPYCRHTEPPCPECGSLMQHVEGLRRCTGVGCGYETPICPKCGAAMVKRTSQYGPFWGCLNYRPNAGTFCTHTINIGSRYRKSPKYGYRGGGR